MTLKLDSTNLSNFKNLANFILILINLIMPAIYSNIEYSDMLAIFYECGKSTLKASRLYSQKFPERKQLSRATFTNIEKTLRLTGTIQFQ